MLSVVCPSLVIWGSVANEFFLALWHGHYRQIDNCCRVTCAQHQASVAEIVFQLARMRQFQLLKSLNRFYVPISWIRTCGMSLSVCLPMYTLSFSSAGALQWTRHIFLLSPATACQYVSISRDTFKHSLYDSSKILCVSCLYYNVWKWTSHFCTSRYGKLNVS